MLILENLPGSAQGFDETYRAGITGAGQSRLSLLNLKKRALSIRHVEVGRQPFFVALLRN